MVFDKKAFTELVKEYSEAFIEANGAVTCEFSTSGDFLAEKLTILHEHRIAIEEKDLYAIWEIFPCEQCKEYNENKPFHVHMIRYLWGNESKYQSHYYNEQRKNKELEKKLQEKDDIIKNNVVIDKKSFKEVTNEAMKNFVNKSIHEVPDSILSSSEIADRLD